MKKWSNLCSLPLDICQAVLQNRVLSAHGLELDQQLQENIVSA